MKKLTKKLKDTSGAISIFAVMIMVFLLPFAIWIGIELPKMHEANQRVKDAVDSAASSAITIIDNSKFEDGEILLDDGTVKALAVQLVGEKLGIDASTGELLPKEGSSIMKEGIEIKVRAIDDADLPPGGSITVSSQVPGKTWTKSISKPTIIVETQVTYKKIGWWGDDLTVYHVGMSQVNLEL